jgi:glycerol kinase
MSKYILAIDQGTTGSTVVIVDKTLHLVSKASKEFPQHYPKPGWVEHNPEEIWASVEYTVKAALQTANISPEDIAAIGITNQRETSLLWDKRTGKPAHNAIVWQDRRTSAYCAELKAKGLEATIRQKTGLVLDPYFSATKLRWMLEEGGLRSRASELAFGTIDTFLVFRLTGNQVHVTDVSNASRTLLMDLESCSFSDELLMLFGLPRSILPEIKSNAEVYGKTQGLSFLPDGIPIAGMAGDQQAALFGQACFAPGDAKCTYGTGAFLLANTGDKIVHSKKGLLTTVAWRVGEQTTYALEGSAFIAGAAVQWLRDGLKIIKSASEIEALAKTVESSGDVVFVPAFAGLGSPHWRPEARAAILGMTRDTHQGHIARACLEGIALQIRDLLVGVEVDRAAPISVLKVDGGAAANNLLMQFQSDILGVDCVRPASLETTALGAAFLAGLGAGFFTSLQEISNAWRQEKRFSPTMPKEEVTRHLSKWEHAVSKA